MTDIPALVAELREIHARSRENAVALGWGVPDELLDESPWSRAADALVAQEAKIAETERAAETAIRQEVRKKREAYDHEAREQIRANRAEAKITAALEALDAIEDRAPHDIDGMVYMFEWAQGIVAGSKRIRRALSDTPPTNQNEQES